MPEYCHFQERKTAVFGKLRWPIICIFHLPSWQQLHSWRMMSLQTAFDKQKMTATLNCPNKTLAFKHLSYITGNKHSDLVIIFTKSLSSSLPILTTYKIRSTCRRQAPISCLETFSSITVAFCLRLLRWCILEGNERVSWYITYWFFLGGPYCTAWGILAPNPGSNLYPLLLKCGLLTIGSQGKCQ